MDSSALSSLDVLSKACQYVATQDSQQTDSVVTSSPIPSYTKPAVKPVTRDIKPNRSHVKETHNNKNREIHNPEDNQKSADFKTTSQQERIVHTHEQTKEINSRKAYPDKINSENNTKNKNERSAPPPPYTQSIEKSHHHHNAKYSLANGVALTPSEAAAKVKEEKMIEELSSQKNKRHSSSEKIAPQQMDGLPPYTTSVNSHITASKSKSNDSQESAIQDKWPTGVHPYMYYPELAAASAERMYADLPNVPHDVKLMDAANAYAMRAGAAIPQLPENFQRLLYPGVNPLAFAPRELSTGLPPGYPGLQSEHLATPLLQAQLSYAADQKRIYESLQGLHPQSAPTQQYLNSILMSNLQDQKSGNSTAAAAALYQRTNPGIVFPVPGYWLPQSFPYPGEGGNMKLPEITSSGILPRRREESPRNSIESGLGTPPMRHQQTNKVEEQLRARQQSPFMPNPLHMHGLTEHVRAKIREGNSPKPKYRNEEKAVNNESVKHNLINESRHIQSESNSKQDAIRRYELLNGDLKENSMNKYSNYKPKMRTSRSPHIPPNSKSPIVEHFKDSNSDKRRNHSPQSDLSNRSEPGAIPTFPGLKFPGSLAPGLMENGLSPAHLAALQAPLLAQQFAMGQLGSGAFLPELLAGHYNNISQMVPNLPTLSPPTLAAHSTSAVHSQADSIRYSLVDAAASRTNGIHENRSSSASAITSASKSKIRRTSPNAEHGISDRYGFDALAQKHIYMSSASPAHKIKSENNVARKDAHRSSQSPHYPYYRNHFENGADKKVHGSTEKPKPPGYMEDYKPSSESEAVDSPSNKRKKTNSEPPAPSIEEHFRRSLGKSYVEPEQEKKVQITGSVDDHFKKSLGDMWSNYQARPHSASPDSMKQRTNEYPPPFIKSSLTDMRRAYTNGNPPPYKDQHGSEPNRKREHPIDPTNVNNMKST